MSNFINNEPPVILFGAFDRHNFGDLLFPHIAAAMLMGSKLLFAGLLERDLRCYGGYHVLAITTLAAELAEQPVQIIHVGGELLTCEAYHAAVMLLAPEQVQEVVARLDTSAHERLIWAQEMLGIDARAPYTLSCKMFPGIVNVIYNAVGGVDLVAADAALRAEVLSKLRAADVVNVRDQVTLALLSGLGVNATLLPDPAVMVAELFGERIAASAREGENAQIFKHFPRGYFAVQFSADFGDDETLTTIAHQLDEVVRSSGLGVVLFRAGAAPWHDDLECYQRLVGFMSSKQVMVFESLNIWDICAVISHSRAYCGSSLHGRIVAMAFALPRINLRHSANRGQPTKQDAFASTWEVANTPGAVAVDQIAAGIEQALIVDAAQLQYMAGELATRYRQGFYSCLGQSRAAKPPTPSAS